MATTVLGPRALNRALLARQLLLERRAMAVPRALEHLVGMQAQVPETPYFGLWARLDGFDPRALSKLVERGRAVRLALMRSTLHLVTARDAVRLRGALDPLFARELRSGAWARFLRGLDFDRLARLAREAMHERPQTFAELGAHLGHAFTGRDRRALAYAARALLPLVQAPPRGLWQQGGLARHAVLDGAIRSSAPDDLVRRYLAAFGPASVQDAQSWSGLRGLAGVFERLRPKLRAFATEDGAELFDLPRAPRPAADTPAPVRFVPPYDNLLLAHVDRTRVLPDTARPAFASPNGVVPGAVLVDGFVAGTWRIGERGLRVELLEALPLQKRRAVEREGEALLTFAADGGPRPKLSIVA